MENIDKSSSTPSVKESEGSAPRLESSGATPIISLLQTQFYSDPSSRLLRSRSPPSFDSPPPKRLGLCPPSQTETGNSFSLVDPSILPSSSAAPLSDPRVPSRPSSPRDPPAAATAAESPPTNVRVPSPNYAGAASGFLLDSSASSVLGSLRSKEDSAASYVRVHPSASSDKSRRAFMSDLGIGLDFLPSDCGGTGSARAESSGAGWNYWSSTNVATVSEAPSSQGEISCSLSKEKMSAIRQKLRELKSIAPTSKISSSGSRTVSAIQFAIDSINSSLEGKERNQISAKEKPSLTKDRSLPPPDAGIDNRKYLRKLPSYLSVVETHPWYSDPEGFAITLDLRTFEITAVSPQLYDLLGYRPDMWLRQSFVKYVSSYDSWTLGTHFAMMQTNFIKGSPGKKETNGDCKGNPLNVYCRLSPYSSLEKGFSFPAERDKIAFKLTCVIHPPRKTLESGESSPDPLSGDESDLSAAEIEWDNEACDKSAIFILASPLYSPYSKPYSLPGGTNQEECAFFTRHDSDCAFTSVDSKVTTLLGHLPQEMCGVSIFQFLHPEDLSLLLDIHQKISVTPHSRMPVINRKAFRLRCYNGSYLWVSTEWTSFLNPWTSLIEFIVGNHTIVQGPADPNVLASNVDKAKPTKPQRAMARQIGKKIRDLLSTPVAQHSSSSESSSVIILGKLPSSQKKSVNNESSKKSIMSLGSFGEELEKLRGQALLIQENDSTARPVVDPEILKVMKETLSLDPPLAPVPVKQVVKEFKGVVDAGAKKEFGDSAPRSAMNDKDASCSCPSDAEPYATYAQLNYAHNIKRFLMSSPQTYTHNRMIRFNPGFLDDDIPLVLPKPACVKSVNSAHSQKVLVSEKDAPLHRDENANCSEDEEMRLEEVEKEKLRDEDQPMQELQKLMQDEAAKKGETLGTESFPAIGKGSKEPLKKIDSGEKSTSRFPDIATEDADKPLYVPQVLTEDLLQHHTRLEKLKFLEDYTQKHWHHHKQQMEDYGVWDEHGVVKEHVLDASLGSQAVVDKHGKLRHVTSKMFQGPDNVKLRSFEKLKKPEEKQKKQEEKRSREKETREESKKRKMTTRTNSVEDGNKKRRKDSPNASYTNPPFKLQTFPSNRPDVNIDPARPNNESRTLYFPYQNLLGTNQASAAPQLLYPLLLRPTSISGGDRDDGLIDVVVAHDGVDRPCRGDGRMTLGGGGGGDPGLMTLESLNEKKEARNSSPENATRIPSLSNFITASLVDGDCTTGASSSAIYINFHGTVPAGRDPETEESSTHDPPKLIRRFLKVGRNASGSSFWLRDVQLSSAILMNYQMPVKDVQQVLEDDVEKHRLMLADKPSNGAVSAILVDQLKQLLAELSFCGGEEDAGAAGFVAEEICTIMVDVASFGFVKSEEKSADAANLPCCFAHRKIKKRIKSGQNSVAPQTLHESNQPESNRRDDEVENPFEWRVAAETDAKLDPAAHPHPRAEMSSMDALDNRSSASGDSGDNGGKASVVSSGSAGKRSDASKKSAGCSSDASKDSSLPTEASGVSLTSSIKESDRNGSDSDSSIEGRSPEIELAKLLSKNLFVDLAEGLTSNVEGGNYVGGGARRKPARKRHSLSVGVAKTVTSVESEGRPSSAPELMIRDSPSDPSSSVELTLQELFKDATSGMTGPGLPSRPNSPKRN